MKHKLITILLGRGIEGCGVTKFTIEQINWLNRNGYGVAAYAIADKSWTRKAAHDVAGIRSVAFSNWLSSGIQEIIETCNDSKYVIVNSLPSVSHSEKCVENFKRLLKCISVPIILIQHDHSSLSINRNAGLYESINLSSLIFTHSPTNDFANTVAQVTSTGGLSNFMDEDVKKILNFQPGMNFDQVRSRFWKDISEQDPKHNKWIGRTTSWKGYKEMFSFHENYLRPNGYLTTLEGIERSPAFLVFRELGEWDGDVNKFNSIESWDLSDGYGKCLKVFGPYNNHDMLERMSRVAFGYQLSILKERFIHRSIEYTHCEVVCTGTVPVFRKKYGETCIHRKYGDPLIQCKDNGTVWLGDEMGDAFSLIDKLSKDSKMRDEYREKAFEFYRLHQDAEFTFKELHNEIEKNI